MISCNRKSDGLQKQSSTTLGGFDLFSGVRKIHAQLVDFNFGPDLAQLMALPEPKPLLNPNLHLDLAKALALLEQETGPCHFWPAVGSSRWQDRTIGVLIGRRVHPPISSLPGTGRYPQWAELLGANGQVGSSSRISKICQISGVTTHIQGFHAAWIQHIWDPTRPAVHHAK